MIRVFAIFLLSTSVMAAADPKSARVCEARSEAIKNLANELALELQKDKIQSVGIQRLQVTWGNNVNYGTSVADEIVRHLLSAGLTIDPDAETAITGEVCVKKGDVSAEGGAANNRYFVKVEVKVCTGKDLKTVLRTIEPHYYYDPTAVIEVAGVTATVAADPDLATVTQQLGDSFVKPLPPAISKTVVRASPASPYGVEILVLGTNSYQPLTPRWEAGKVIVDLKKGDIYMLRLHNSDTLDSVAKTGIDGLDVFCRFQTDKPGGEVPNMLLIDRKKDRQPHPIEVKGWVNTLMKSEQFKVEDFSLSLAAAPINGKRLDRAPWLTPEVGKGGVIVVKFAPLGTRTNGREQATLLAVHMELASGPALRNRGRRSKKLSATSIPLSPSRTRGNGDNRSGTRGNP